MTGNINLNNKLKNLLEVHAKLLPAQNEWYNLGLALDIANYNLQDIQFNNRNNSDCLREMLNLWLQSTPSPIWTDMCKALRSPTVNHIALAGKIEEEQKNRISKEVTNTDYVYVEISNCVHKRKCLIAVIVAVLAALLILLPACQRQGEINQILREHYKNLEEIDFEKYLPNNMKPKQIPFIIPNVRIADQYTDMPSVKYLLETVEEGTRIAITGRPGVGKSTLARYIAKLWANGESLQQFTTLFHICLGRASEAITDLKQIMEEECHGLIHPEFPKQEISELLNKIKDTQGENILFLLDGFDEYIPNHCERKNKLACVLSLIKGNFLPKSAVIVMSRPRSVADFKHSFRNMFEVTGFRKSDIEMSLSHLEVPLRTSIQNYFENNPNVKNLCYLPLHMTMIIYLASLEEDPLSELDRETRIFKNFLDLTIAHYQKRHNLSTSRLDECFEHPSLSKKDSLCSLFLSVCELAYTATLHNQQTFSSNEIQQINISTDILQKLSFFNIKKENRRYGHTDEFSFSHQNFRDFMSAYHLVLLPISDQKRIIKKYANELIFRDSVWKFYFGLLGEQNNDTALRSLFQCYVEYGGYEQLPTKYYEIDFYPLSFAFETGLHHVEFIELLDYAHIVGPGNNHSLQINVKEPIDTLSFLNLDENNINTNVNFLLMKHTLELIIIRFIRIQLQINASTLDPNTLCSNVSWIPVNNWKYEKLRRISQFCNHTHNMTTINPIVRYVAIVELEYFHPVKEVIDLRIVFDMLQGSGFLKFAGDIKTEMIKYLNTTQNSEMSSLKKSKLLEIILTNHTHSNSENLTHEELSFMQIWNCFDKYEKTLSNQQNTFNFSDLRKFKIQHDFHNLENLCLVLKSATKLEVLDLSNIVLDLNKPAFLNLFQSLPYLKVLDLSHSLINLHWLAMGFKNMKTLRELKVSGGHFYNKFGFGISQNKTFGNQLVHLKKLEVLDLSDGRYDNSFKKNILMV